MKSARHVSPSVFEWYLNLSLAEQKRVKRLAVTLLRNRIADTTVMAVEIIHAAWRKDHDSRHWQSEAI